MDGRIHEFPDLFCTDRVDLVSSVKPGELTVIHGFYQISVEIHKHPLLHLANSRNVERPYIIEELGDPSFDAEGHRGEVAKVVFVLRRHGGLYA